MRRLARLFRLPLALLNGAAALGGYLLHPGTPRLAEGGRLLLGVALLAAAGSAWNQLLERDLDGRMERTRSRPLPSGELSPRSALVLGGAALAAGLALLPSGGSFLPAALSASALAWYLAVYTPLKRSTPLAVAVGALSGAVPPLVGWCAAGGAPGDPRAVLLPGLLYLWQVPHFFLLQQRHPEDPARAGLPLPWGPPGGRRCRALLLLWLSALAAASAPFALLAAAPGGGVAAAALLTVPLAVAALGRSPRLRSACLDLFPLLVTALLLLRR